MTKLARSGLALVCAMLVAAATVLPRAGGAPVIPKRGGEAIEMPAKAESTGPAEATAEATNPAAGAVTGGEQQPSNAPPDPAEAVAPTSTPAAESKDVSDIPDSASPQATADGAEQTPPPAPPADMAATAGAGGREATKVADSTDVHPPQAPPGNITADDVDPLFDDEVVDWDGYGEDEKAQAGREKDFDVGILPRHWGQLRAIDSVLTPPLSFVQVEYQTYLSEMKDEMMSDKVRGRARVDAVSLFVFALSPGYSSLLAASARRDHRRAAGAEGEWKRSEGQ